MHHIKSTFQLSKRGGCLAAGLCSLLVAAPNWSAPAGDEEEAESYKIAAPMEWWHSIKKVNPGPPRWLAPEGAKSYVVMLGTAPPPPFPYRAGIGVAVIAGGVPYIVDAGEGILRSAVKASLAHGERFRNELFMHNLAHLFLTHLHVDHTAGLPSLTTLLWAMHRPTPMQVWGPPGTADMIRNLEDAFKLDIQDRILGEKNPHDWRSVPHDIGKDGLIYKDENVRVEAFAHQHSATLKAFAYRFTTAERSFLIAGDGTYDVRLLAAARNVDVLVTEAHTEDNFHRVLWGGETMEERQQTIFGLYHMRPSMLAELARKAGVKTVVLYHEGNLSHPFESEALLNEVKRHYEGEGVIHSSRDGDVF